MQCDLGSCDEDAVVLVHFKTVRTPYAYCAHHGLKWGKAEHRFGRFDGSGRQRRWVTAVRHEQRVSPTGRNR